jgi:voltage-gated potassium channel
MDVFGRPIEDVEDKGKIVNSIRCNQLQSLVLPEQLPFMRNQNLPDINFYTYTGSYLSLRTALLLFIGLIVVGVAGLMIIEGYTVTEALYMTIITISTVGYTEVRPLSEPGKLFLSIYIISNIGIFAYTLAVFSYYIIEGAYFKKLHFNFLERKIRHLKDHVIICGYGRYGREAAENFGKHDVPFVIIERDSNSIEEIQSSESRVLYVHDDATHDDVLIQAGIEKASALITALPDDSDNLFTVLSARQLNPKINIISRAKNEKTERKLRLAGADHVVMPDQIGGFYMATLVSKPGAIEFFTWLTNNQASDIAFEELSFKDMPDVCRNKSIHDLRIREATGTNIIGYMKPDGSFEVNPSPNTILREGSAFIVLGTPKQLVQLRNYLQEYS